MSDAPVKAAARRWGRRPRRMGVNFSVFSRHATGVELLLFDAVDDAKPARVVRLDPSTNRTYHYWHVFVPGRPPRPAVRVPGRGPVRSGERPALRSHQGAPGSLRPGRRGSPRPTVATPRGAPGDNAGDGHEERGGRRLRVRLGGRCAPAATVVADHRVRDARRRLHPASELWPAGEDSRDVRRPDREDSLSASGSASRRWSCCRCSSSTLRTVRPAW